VKRAGICLHILAAKQAREVFMPGATLGARIRKLRENLNITRSQLAETTGLPEIFIATMEEENLCPSLAPLQKIARALGVRMGTFMDDQIARDPVINRREDRETDMSMQKALNKRAAFRYHSLGKGKTDRAMEPFYIEISPEDTEDQTLSSHQGEEFILVVQGRLKLIYGKETHVLEPGDSVYYNSIVPHYVGTASSEEAATIYAVIYNPE
jgi:transcriptional regulator with XRE-family HTH domain